MPAPSPAQLEAIASAALQQAGLRGESMPALAKALAQATSQALTLFLSQAIVLPGIPATLAPVTGTGSTVGPGRLAPPPLGGPLAPQLEGLALAALRGQGLRGERITDLAGALAAGLAQAIQQFTAQVQVAPGITVAGFVTTSPGSLL